MNTAKSRRKLGSHPKFGKSPRFHRRNSQTLRQQTRKTVRKTLSVSTMPKKTIWSLKIQSNGVRPIIILNLRDLLANDDWVILADLVLRHFFVVERAIVHVRIAVDRAEETAASTLEPCDAQKQTSCNI